MNKPAFLLKPRGAALRLKTHPKETSLHHPKKTLHKQIFDSLTDTPVERSVLPPQSTSHTGAHLMQPSSEAYEAEDRCFRVSLARRLIPHPAAPNATDVVQSLPQQKCSRPHLQQTSGHTTAPLLRMSVRRRCRSQAMQQWARCLADVIQWRQGMHRTGSTCSYSRCQRPA